MPSVGSLLVTVVADTKQLRDDLDKAMGKIRELETGTRQMSDQSAKGFERLGLSGEKSGKVLGQVAGAALMASGAFGKANEAGKVLGDTLSAYLMGGPIAAGIVGLSGGFRLLAEEIGKSSGVAGSAKKHFDGLMSGLTAGTDKALADLEEIDLKLRVQELKKKGLITDTSALSNDELANQLELQALQENWRVGKMRSRLRQLRLAGGEMTESLSERLERERLEGALPGEERRAAETNRERMAQAEFLRELNVKRERLRKIEAGEDPDAPPAGFKSDGSGGGWIPSGGKLGGMERISAEQLRVLQRIEGKMDGGLR